MAVLSALISGCGMENYFYLYPVSPGNITTELNSRATVRLPLSPQQVADSGEYNYFTNFIIYYRIYVSDVAESGSIQLSQAALNRINPSLASDYFSLEQYLSSETSVNTAVGSLFRNRNYYPLELDGENIDRDVLGKGSVGETIIIDFPQIPGSVPSLTISTLGYGPFSLYRSTGGGNFFPRPNRYFINSSQLSAPENITAGVNVDTVNKYGISGPRYTYVSMYIVVSGIDPNYSPIYSTPAFIGIFRLPDPL
jgi:hypothetical protein